MEIDSMMKETRVFMPSKEFSSKAHIKSLEEYNNLYKESIEDPEEFWAKQAEIIEWSKRWEKVHSNHEDFHEWFLGGKLNACYNCLDRHLEKRGDKTALIVEYYDGTVKKYTYKELHSEVCKFANVLKKNGIKKGDRIAVYLQMVPELAISMLACARIGAIHSVVFGGFSPESLKDRIQDAEAKILVTMEEAFIRGKPIPVKAEVDKIIGECPSIEKVIVVKRNEGKIQMQEGRDIWWHEEIGNASEECPCEEMSSEEILFILYTSGTTGKPKGVVHTTGGYMVYVTLTTKLVFDLHEDDVYWCTADCGWITGHSYIVYGPLSNGATTIMLEGNALYPDPARSWDMVEKHKITIYYTAPTLIRSLMREGDEWTKKHDISTLRLLGSVGEPINPEAWMWYYTKIGKEKCPVVDTWWQTETGGIMITPLPGATPLKPGSATYPFFGIAPEVLKEDGSEAQPGEGGNLVITKPWPSMIRTVWKNPDRYEKTYFGKYKGKYLTGDGARKDDEEYFWVLGRIDDVVKVSGHRIGTAEVESALVSHPDVAEAAVAPFPHDIKGQAIYAFVTLKENVKGSAELVEALRKHVAHKMGPIAKPDKIQFTEQLPKTRSGKIMRRILKAIASGEEDVGNITTLANPEAVEEIRKNRL